MNAASSASPPVEERHLSSFDGGLSITQPVVRPDRYRNLPQSGPCIVRGGGYSYAAASMGGGGIVVDNSRFDRILAFDEDAGTIECEAGTSLGKLFAVAERAGWYLPVQPGYPAITIGGCIAADVHGKNQHRDGTFRRWVREIEVFHPSRGFRKASLQVDPDLFDLTCGGFGLTGQITRVRLQLQKLPSRSIEMTRSRVRSFDDLADVLDELADKADLLYTWHNGTTRGVFGSGYVVSARFTSGLARRLHPQVRAITAESRSRLRVQFLNSWTTPIFNRVYEAYLSMSPRQETLDLFEFLFPVATKVIYFELFGSRGLHEYQVIVPRQRFTDFSHRLGDYVSKYSVPITLLSCKLFRGQQSLLRFDGSGICVAIDIPRNRSSSAFLEFLDALTIECGALPNVSKDSRLPLPVVERCYGELSLFRDRLHALDPQRVFRSELSGRLRL